MREATYKKREVTIHKCRRCGKEMLRDEKFFVQMRRNVAQPFVEYESYTGGKYRIQPQPKIITTKTYGLCKDCALEAEDALRAFMGGVEDA